MENPNFVEPEAQVVSKQKILDDLKEWFSRKNYPETTEIIKWIDSITNEVTLTFYEANEVISLLTSANKYIYKPALLFNIIFFPDVRDHDSWVLTNASFEHIQDDPVFLLIKRFFRTDLLDDERIKSIPFLFKKIGDKITFHQECERVMEKRLSGFSLDEEEYLEVAGAAHADIRDTNLLEKIGDKVIIHPFVGEIIKEIRAHCARNEEFAKAYRAKLDEIRNNNGTLLEKLALYGYAYRSYFAWVRVSSYRDACPRYDKSGCKALIFELEQPVFEMARAYLNDVTIYDTSFSHISEITEERKANDPFLYLSFVSLLQTPDGMQVPRWNEENYLCRLLLDYEIIYHFGILDKLFRDYTTTDIVLIICNHLKWRNDIMPRNPEEDFESKPEKVWKKHRKKYAKFLKAQLPTLFSGDILQVYSNLLHDHYFNYIYREDNEYLGHIRCDYNDLVQRYVSNYLHDYIIKKIISAINENNHEQIRDISRLLDNEGNDLMETLGVQWCKVLQLCISIAMKFFENGDHAKKRRNIFRDSEYHFSFRNFLLYLVKDQKNKNPSLSLEDFVQKYIPLEIFPHILYHVDFFQEQNEDVYLSMIQQYPGLNREDALLDRLLPCFTALAIKNPDEMLTLLNWAGTQQHTRYFIYNDPTVQLFLCVLDQLCEKYEKEHVSIELIFEIIFISLYSVPLMLDIIKKYPQVQQLVFEHCYTILKGSWDTPICTPLSSHQIQAHIPARIIGMHKGLWHGLKPLLIALRKTRMEWVDTSLNINSYCHPNDNNNLVGEIELYLNFCHDLSLKDLRQDMANGLSDWLKPLPESKRSDLEKRLAEFPEIEKDREGFDITYTEPDPIWRYAYVRAIADMGLTLTAKGIIFIL